MNFIRGMMPAFPPLEDEQAARLLRVLRAIAYSGLFASIGFLFILYSSTFRPEQYRLVHLHQFILYLVLIYCCISLYIMPRGIQLRLGGALQIISLWLSLTIVPDLMGIPLHVVAANHVALAICIGPLMGWLGAFTLGSASLVYVLIQDSTFSLGSGIAPLLLLTPAQVYIIEVALYGLVLSITVLIVFLSQRRSEISQVTAEALEVASYSEKRLETIIESMADVLLVVDKNGEIIKANRAAFTLLGYTETELSGKPLRTLLMDIPDKSTGIEGMLKQQAMRHVSRHLKTRDGRVLPVSMSSSVLTDHADQPTGVILVAQDMTELEAVRTQLHISNVRFNQATQFSRIGVFEFDMTTGEFVADEPMRQMVKASGMEVFISYEEFTGMVVEEDRERLADSLVAYRSGEKPRVEVEFRVNTTRGVRWILVRGSQQEESGPYLIGTFMDVTRRKHAELELARRDDMLRAVSQSSEVFLRLSDWEAHVPTMLRELGAAAQVSRAYIIRNHIDPDGRIRASQTDEWVAQDIKSELGNPNLRNMDWEGMGLGSYVAQMKEGYPVHGIISSLEDEALRTFYGSQDIKSLVAMPVFVQDEWWGIIGFDDCWTERVWSEPEIDALQLAADSLGAAIYRQRTEMNLQENRDFLMSIMDNLGQGVMVMDGEARLLFGNKVISNLIGIPVEKMFGHKPDNFVDPDFMPVVMQNRTQRMQGKTTSYASRIVHVDGTKTDVFVTGVPRYVNGKADGSYSLVTDISERRRMEAAQMQISTEREQMRIMSEFVRDASHDFRTPLSIIQTSLYLLRRKAESPEQLERLQTVGVQASRLSRLIDGLLTMLELDKADLTLIPINVKMVAQNAVDRSRESAHKAGLALDMMSPEEACFVNGEEGYLMKAVSNLIDNAIAFTPSGGRIKVNLTADDERVELKVTDSGLGIAPDEHQRIFERLYKVDKARTIDSGGLGMGLAITKRIMELHGGVVSVSSTPGEGSVFTLGLTRVKPMAPRPRNSPSSSPITEDVKM